MCYRIKVKKDMKKAHICAYGRINILQLREIFYETFRHQDWKPGFDILCDYRKIESLSITSKDIVDILEWYKTVDNLIGSGRSAVVASKGFTNVMNSIRQLPPVEGFQRIRIFYSMTEALSWLNQ